MPVCENSDIRERKNLANLNATEKHDLIEALRKAKIRGTYHGPNITGLANNPSDFLAAYDAATSFHGYPGLCAGPGADDGGGCCIHGYSTFLPWHRLFMMQLEDSLRSIPGFAHVTLPYWDWTQNFSELPLLVRNSLIADPTNPSTIIDNPFFQSVIPGLGHVTKRSPKFLIDYTNHDCISPGNCINATQSWDGLSVLMDLTLTALEEREYESFEKLIEYPHNMVHDQLGFVPKTGGDISACINQSICYPYTMQNTYYSSYDPIFLPFHTMVDYQWAVFQALQEHRNISYKEDCHPGFMADLQPFNRDLNSNNITKSHSRGDDVINYTKSLGYRYDKLSLNNMTIPELNKFLDKRNDKDRLFAGFSLPNIHINYIKFQVCHENVCYGIFPPAVQVHKNKNEHSGVYSNPNLLYIEVTRSLSTYGLTPDQNLRFQIVSTSIPEIITYSPVSIFRKAGTNKDQITIHWPESETRFKYAPFFKVRQARNSTLRFLLENGTLAVYKYKDREALETCSEDGRTLLNDEIDVEENTEYYFQNPAMDCNKENKIIIDRINTCSWGDFKKEKNGSATIGWQLDMSKYRKEGVCMEPGTFLTLHWRRGYHAVLDRNQSQYDDCSVENGDNAYGWNSAPNSTIFPASHEGFSLNGKNKTTYYIICPVGSGSHCLQGMKLKILVQKICPNK